MKKQRGIILVSIILLLVLITNIIMLADTGYDLFTGRSYPAG